MESSIKSKVISFSIRAAVAISALMAYYVTFTALEQLGENPLAYHVIWGVWSGVVLSFGVIYLINDNKETQQ